MKLRNALAIRKRRITFAIGRKTICNSATSILSIEIAESFEFDRGSRTRGGVFEEDRLGTKLESKNIINSSTVLLVHSERVKKGCRGVHGVCARNDGTVVLRNVAIGEEQCGNLDIRFPTGRCSVKRHRKFAVCPR